MSEKLMAEACSSYNPRGPICADGFIQKPICSGHGSCWQCGQYKETSTPNCQREDLPSHWLTDSGEPAFYRSNAAR